jgi:hypothetical protein
LLVSNGGTGATSITSGALVKGNGTNAFTAATAAEISSALGSTAVTNATNATTAATVSTTVASGATGTTQSNGDNSTKMATTAHVYGMAIGWGQTWQNMTSSRLASTTYTNSTGKPIMVNIHYAQFSQVTWDMALYVGGVLVARDAGGASGRGADGGGTCSAIVPAGATYYFTGQFNIWAELR